MKTNRTILNLRNVKISLVSIIFFTVCTSCWAPRCPMETCRSKYEHRHNDLVAGTFSPRYGIPHKMHFVWDKDKGEYNPNTDFVPGAGGTKKGKTKKKFPWERW